MTLMSIVSDVARLKDKLLAINGALSAQPLLMAH
jgi:hypothetical protein